MHAASGVSAQVAGWLGHSAALPQISYAQVMLHVLETSWQAIVLAVVVLLLGWLLGDRLSARWRCALWLIVVGRLLLPVAPQSPVSLFNYLPVNPMLRAAVEVTEPSVATDPIALLPTQPPGPLAEPVGADADFVAAPPFPNPSTSRPKAEPVPGATALSPWQIVSLVWLVGMVLIVLRLLVMLVRLRRLLRQCWPVMDCDVQRAFEAAKRELGVQRHVELVATSAKVGPAVAGVLRPRIILSDSLLATLSADELRLVFLHELSHVRRHDLAVQRLWIVAEMLHWFNPVVWLAARRWQADRELACDEAVLAQLDGPARGGYGQTILRVMESLGGFRPVPGAVGVVLGRRFLARTIGMIVRYRPRARGWTVLAAALLLALIPIGLTNAVEQSDEPAMSDEVTAAATDEASLPLPSDADKPDGAEHKITIFSLQYLKADHAAATIKRLYFGGDEAKNRDQFRIFADVKRNKLVLRANAAQTKEIKKLLAELDVPLREMGSARKDREASGLSRAAAKSQADPLSMDAKKTITIAGKCVDEKGKPLAGAEVVVYERWSDKRGGYQTKVAEAKTDRQGKFRFADLPAPFVDRKGKRALCYDVWARKSGRASADISVDPGKRKPAELKLKMPPAASLRGRITDETGIPIAGALVSDRTGLESPGEGFRAARTNVEGRFEIDDLPPLSAEDAAKHFSRRGRPPRSTVFAVEHPDFAADQISVKQIPATVDGVTLQRAGAIEGRVVDANSGHPLAGVNLIASITDRAGKAVSGYYTRASRRSASRGIAETDQNGHYRIASLRPGKFRVQASVKDRPHMVVGLFEVRPGQTHVAGDFKMVRGGIIEGRIVDAVTGKPVVQQGWYGTIIVCTATRDKNSPSHVAQVDKNGHFRLHVLPGRNLFRISDADLWKRLERREKYEKGVDVEEGETIQIEFRVTPEKSIPQPPTKPPKTSAASSPPPMPGERETTTAIRRLGGRCAVDKDGRVPCNAVH